MGDIFLFPLYVWRFFIRVTCLTLVYIASMTGLTILCAAVIVLMFGLSSELDLGSQFLTQLAFFSITTPVAITLGFVMIYAVSALNPLYVLAFKNKESSLLYRYNPYQVARLFSALNVFILLFYIIGSMFQFLFEEPLGLYELLFYLTDVLLKGIFFDLAESLDVNIRPSVTKTTYGVIAELLLRLMAQLIFIYFVVSAWKERKVPLREGYQASGNAVFAD